MLSEACMGSLDAERALTSASSRSSSRKHTVSEYSVAQAYFLASGAVAGS